jgi:hypothetical protein
MIIRNENFSGNGFAGGGTISRQIETQEKQQIMKELFKKKIEGIEEQPEPEIEECMNTRFNINMNHTLEVIDDVLYNINKEFKHKDDFRSIFFIDSNLIKHDRICMISSFLEGEENLEKYDIWETRMDFMHEVLSDHGIHEEILETAIWYYYTNRHKKNCFEMMNLIVIGESDENV